MTPIDKAKELVNKFYHTSSHPNSVTVRKDNAIKCAKICVEEILKATPTMPANFKDIDSEINEADTYWQSVLNELNKMQ